MEGRNVEERSLVQLWDWNLSIRRKMYKVGKSRRHLKTRHSWIHRDVHDVDDRIVRMMRMLPSLMGMLRSRMRLSVDSMRNLLIVLLRMH
jgi:hypothetical protein